MSPATPDQHPFRAAPPVRRAAWARRPAWRAAGLGVALALALSMPAVQAAPEASAAGGAAETDPITQLLMDRGVLPAGTPAVVQSMRDRASEMVISAMNFLGVPYRRGGDSESEGFDCSGFTRHIFELSLGMALPRRAAEQAQSSLLRQVRKEELKPGDLVFFNTMRRAFSHVGIYIGDGKFIHSPRTGGEVRIEDMRQAYWTTRFNGARRADGLSGPATAAASLAAPAATATPAAAALAGTTPAPTTGGTAAATAPSNAPLSAASP